MDGAAAEPEPALRALKVLVLDNDRTMRELLAMALQRMGVEGIPAASLAEAEAVLGEVDGLLLDFHLGAGYSGAEVARRWAEEGRLPPFWLVTGVPEEVEVKGLSGLRELMGVVGKPFSLLELAGEVESTLRKLAPPLGADAVSSFEEQRTYVHSEPSDPGRLEDGMEAWMAEGVPTDEHH